MLTIVILLSVCNVCIYTNKYCIIFEYNITIGLDPINYIFRAEYVLFTGSFESKNGCLKQIGIARMYI